MTEDYQMKLPGEELAIKIFESVVKGAGVFSRPWQIKREAIAKAEAERIRLLGQEAARLQIEKIRSGELQIDENLKLISHDTDEDADGVQEIAEEYISVLRKSDISPGRLLEVEQAPWRYITFSQYGEKVIYLQGACSKWSIKLI